jgi:hypothetical protein
MEQTSGTYSDQAFAGAVETSGNLMAMNQNTMQHTSQYQASLGCVQVWPYDYQPYHPYPSYPVYVTTAPSWCSGQVHVFGCEHAEVCKCGKAKREKPACAHCGK